MSRVIQIEASKKILPRPCVKTATFAYLVMMWVFFRCEQWDVVNNMFEVDNFLTDIYGSDKIIAELYQRSKEVDYAAKLFVNHIGLVDSSIHIQVIKN